MTLLVACVDQELVLVDELIWEEHPAFSAISPYLLGDASSDGATISFTLPDVAGAGSATYDTIPLTGDFRLAASFRLEADDVGVDGVALTLFDPDAGFDGPWLGGTGGCLGYGARRRLCLEASTGLPGITVEIDHWLNPWDEAVPEVAVARDGAEDDPEVRVDFDGRPAFELELRVVDGALSVWIDGELIVEDAGAPPALAYAVVSSGSGDARGVARLDALRGWRRVEP